MQDVSTATALLIATARKVGKPVYYRRKGQDCLTTGHTRLEAGFQFIAGYQDEELVSVFQINACVMITTQPPESEEGK